MKKKFLSLILICAIIASFSMVLVACDEQKEVEKPLSIVYIGDSIAEAVIGPSPICERESYGYHAVIGKRNEYEYFNRSVSGHLTDDLYELLQSEDTNAKMFISTIKQCDIIQVSILGNNFLQRDLNKMTLEAAKNDYSTIEEILNGNELEDISSAIADFREIIALLKSYNKNAVILVQTIYNPLYIESDLVSEETKDILRNEYGMVDSQCREFAQIMMNKLNGVIFDYKKEHPEDIEIIDVNAEFNKINDADEQRGRRLIFSDWVHPSNEGHAVIADVTQEKLEKLGLANHNKALENYKNLKIEQLNRLYEKSVDVNEISSLINKAQSCKEITKIYFDAVNGKTPIYC